MQISQRGLDRLAEIITGDTPESPYRSGPQLVEFFHDFGERDLYGQGFPSRATYTIDKLKKFNGTSVLRDIVLAALDFWDSPEHNPENLARQFNRHLSRSGVRLVIEYGPGWMQGGEHVRGEPYFDFRSISEGTILVPKLTILSHEGVREQITKANDRIERGDHAGAIASSYTLLEELLKQMLADADVPFKATEGDIRKLYAELRQPMGLDPSQPSISAPLKPILDGLQKITAGLYEAANKASDRHARVYKPSAHHAKLVVNSAFSLCEFLLESREHRNKLASMS